MSFINFLGLEDPNYGSYAKGILYVIYDILWKIVNAVGSLIDVVTGLFYKLAGANYLGSGSEELVEKQDLLSKLFNENIISSFSIFMMITSVVLMTIFGTIAVLKQNYLSKQEARSTTDVIKNMILAFIFIICLSPISMFLMSSITTITSSIVSVFGGESNVSLADLLFNASFSGDAVTAYNTIYGTEITNWTQMNSSFLFDLSYGATQTGVTFYWYIYLIGGGIVLYNLIVVVFSLVKRIFMILILYILAPIYAAKMVDDGGNKFREWKNKALSELVSIIGTVVAFMILISFVGIISNIELVSVSTNDSTGAIAGEAGTTTINGTALLINNLAKVLLLMAGTAVTKDSGTLLGNVFKGANDDSNSLLEGIFNRLGPKEYDVESTANKGQAAPRTRIITKTTTTTRNITDFSEDVPIAPKSNDRPINVVNNQRNTFSTNVNNIDRHIDNIQNRSTVNVSSPSRSSSSGAKTGNFRNQVTDQSGVKSKPTDALNKSFINTYKQENNKMRKEWELLKGKNSANSSDVIKEFEGASKDLDSAISLGDQTKIKTSMNKYVTAYKKEEKIAKDGYKEFAGKSTKLSNDLSAKQQEELRNISAAYKKAQVDYGKTARKLTEVSRGNMSVADALGVKERADKQRAKLMEASSRASEFYNNQKKGA